MAADRTAAPIMPPIPGAICGVGSAPTIPAPTARAIRAEPTAQAAGTVGEAVVVVVVVVVTVAAINDARPAVCDRHFRMIIPTAF
jgi:hypothetical protein